MQADYADLLSDQVVLGVDEAGRGPLAGPVVASAVILDHKKPIAGLKDSKQTTKNHRQSLFVEIMQKAIAVSVSVIDVETIDRLNILQATLMAMRKAILEVNKSHHVDLVLIDGNQTVPHLDVLKQKAVIKGDQLIPAIMAASIIAKVHRDALMDDYDRLYPAYGFISNKGYGTALHMAAIKDCGPSPIHRRSFAPLKHLLI